MSAVMIKFISSFNARLSDAANGDIVVGGIFRLEDGSAPGNNALNPYQDGVYPVTRQAIVPGADGGGIAGYLEC